MDNELLDGYRRHLDEVLLPFWDRALDHEHGGVYTCFTNTGDELVSTDKYTWSQGRFLWLWSTIADMSAKGKLKGKERNYHDHLLKTARFLEKNVFLNNGNCAFLLTEKGEKKESIPGKGFDTSLYADCFVALGLGKFAALSNDKKRFQKALQLYLRIRRRIEEGNIRTEPYPVPEGYRAHSIPMIMLNVAQELADAADQLNHPKQEKLYRHSISYMKDVMDNFYQEEDHRVVEMLPDNLSSEGETLLDTHVNPGHTIESMWFVIHTAQQTGHPDYCHQTVKAIEKAIDIGWDSEFGGLFRFTGKKGGKPQGKKKSTPYEQLIMDSWDLKLWWPHSEALYATLLAFVITEEEKMLRQYKMVRDYVFETFPNPNKEIGEWIQIRNREGEPVDKIAALPVKDPFHILRNILLIIDLLDEKIEDE